MSFKAETDFSTEQYSDEEDLESKNDICVVISDDSEHSEDEDMKNVKSNNARLNSGSSRDRSRSPISSEPAYENNIRPPPSGIVIRMTNDGSSHDEVEQDMVMVLDAHTLDADDADTLDTDDRNFHILDAHTPDVHTVLNTDDNDIGTRNDEGARNGRHRNVGYRSARGRNLKSRGSSRGARNQQSLTMIDHSQEEIWTSNNDVPNKLGEMTDDVTKGETRAQVTRDKAARSLRIRCEEFEWEISDSDDDPEYEYEASDDNTLLENEISFDDWLDMETYQAKHEIFTPVRTGALNHYSSAYAAFRSIWDDNIIENMVESINRYAQGKKSADFQKDWHPTNTHEVLCFFAFWIMSGIIRMPTVQSCFSTDPLLKTDIFRKMFTIERYRSLMKVWHAYDPNSIPTKSSGTPLNTLQRLTPIINHLNAKFQSNYVPSQDISIYEGKYNCTMYNQMRVRVNLSTFELYESSTGYMWSFIVFSGKESNLDLPGKPLGRNNSVIVQKLIGPLLNKGYRLFMNDTFNSVHLARFLKRNGTDCVGTLNPKCLDVPGVINFTPLKEGQVIARHSGDVCVLSWQPSKSKKVTMISTCHGAATGLERIPSKSVGQGLRFKPQVILDYNNSMSGVDLKDETLEPYLVESQNTKWYIKLMKRFLNVSILNARILMESSIQSQEDHLKFRLALVNSIITHHLIYCPHPRRFTVGFNSKSKLPNPLRTAPYIHWPIRIKLVNKNNRKARLKCFVCIREGRTSSTIYKCEGCDVPLCIENCFKNYHSLS